MGRPSGLGWARAFVMFKRDAARLSEHLRGTVKGDAMTLTVAVEGKSQSRRNTDFFVGKKAT